MKVLFAVSEAAPIVKIGGLGDVAGSLPKALEKLGVDIDVAIPYYSIIDPAKYKIIKQFDMTIPFAGATHHVGVYKTKLPESSVDVLMFRNLKYLSGGGIKAFSSLKDEVERFAFFDRAIVEYIKLSFNTYDLVHCQDWHTGVITHILEEEVGEERPATLFTIHNVAYQGQAGLELVQELDLSIPAHQILQWDLEDGNINFMLEGAASSDALSTVSPTYAKELLFNDIGGQISEILAARKDRFFGILNGIDYDFFNPKKDKHLHTRYDHTSFKAGKQANKTALQKEIGLTQKQVPLIAMVTRLDVKQKGLDILAEALDAIFEQDVQFVLLGKGDPAFEKRLEKLAGLKKLHGKLAIKLGFDEGLARRIYASSDMFLMPSRTEPCGLGQMIAMRYGSLPIVHSTGGLRDTVADGVDGFCFNVFSGNALLRSVTKACKLWGSDKWQTMVKHAMQKDFSWDKSALDYLDLYKKVIAIRKSS